MTKAKFQVLFNLATWSNYSITNYIKIPVFHFLAKVNEGHLKLVNVMSIIKNGQILLYCHFNIIIKGPGTSFQFPALGQKHVRNVFHTTH